MKRQNPIVPATAHPLDENTQRVAELFDDWWKDKSAQTRKSYKESLEEFRKFREAESAGEAVKALCRLTHGEANQIALKFKNWLRERGGKPNTVNARLSALKSMVQAFNAAGLCPWVLNCRGEKTRVYKDVRGPGSDNYQAMLEAARAQEDWKLAARDYAILRLLGSQAFRRNGVASLDLAHIDFEEKCAWVLLKGSRVDRTRFTLSDEVLEAIAEWVKIRGGRAGPLFPGRKAGSYIGGGAVWAMVKRIGKLCGVDTWCHALRHQGISEALEATDGDVRSVMAFSGHKQIQTLLIYDDARTDKGGEVAKKVGKLHK